MKRGRPVTRPDTRTLNIKMDAKVHDMLDQVCRITGQTKTSATERAVYIYAKKIIEEGGFGNG